jgi:hypothetical protein
MPRCEPGPRSSAGQNGQWTMAKNFSDDFRVNWRSSDRRSSEKFGEELFGSSEIFFSVFLGETRLL